MARFLMTTWPIPGHANPSLAVAHALRDRGHDVAFYTGRRAQPMIEAEGFRVFGFARVDEAAVDRVFFDAHDLGWRERWMGQRERMRDWLIGTLPGQVADQIDAVRKWRPDVLLCDSSMWGPYVVVRDIERLPVVILQFQMGCFLPGPDAPPPGFGLPPPRDWRTRGLARAARVLLAMATRDFRDRVNDVRRQYQLPPLVVSPTVQAGRMALYLVTSVPELDYQRGDLPPTVKYVGPCIWNKPHDRPPPAWVVKLPRDRPVVHVCEGTVHARQPILLRAAARGLANAPCHVVMTTGTHRRPESLDLGSLAANIRVEPWVPHTDLFPVTDLVVTTGGAGTVLTALRFGIPLLVVPTEWDKPESARRVVESGVGLALSPRRCTPERLRSAVERLLTDRRFRDAAHRVARSLAEHGGANRAAALIEEAVGAKADAMRQGLPRRPVRRPVRRSAEREGGSVLITGASSGLGLETALYLAERDMQVYASMPDLAEAATVERCARERGVSVRALELDITRPASIEAAVRTVMEETGGIWALVNNAGTRLRGCFEDLADDEVRTLFDTNVFGTMAVTRGVLPAMRAARRGRIVMMTSVAGRIGSFGVGAYCATKFAQEGFGESLALELAPFGIQVALVEPGIVNTTAWNVHRVVGRGTDDPRSPYFTWFHRAEALADDFVRSSPIRPRDVAEAVHRALTARRPRLRYLVGRRATAVIGLRRHLPGELFERFYFGQLMRRVLHGDQDTRRTHESND